MLVTTNVKLELERTATAFLRDLDTQAGMLATATPAATRSTWAVYADPRSHLMVCSRSPT